jgi:Kyakuja-Dileera-Zisupton transposase
MPCSPYTPTTAISIRTLELFHVTQLRGPHISIHSFVKTLCDLHTIPFKFYLFCQFSITLDLYLSIWTLVDHAVQAALLRDMADWCLHHLCPQCTYTLVGEEKLKFSMLYTGDGNDLLKRIVWQEEAPPTLTETDKPVLGESSEATDTRQAGKNIYLTREQVDEWSKEILDEWNILNDDDEESLCAKCWRNMKTELTTRMWEIFWGDQAIPSSLSPWLCPPSGWYGL